MCLRPTISRKGGVLFMEKHAAREIQFADVLAQPQAWGWHITQILHTQHTEKKSNPPKEKKKMLKTPTHKLSADVP